MRTKYTVEISTSYADGDLVLTSGIFGLTKIFDRVCRLRIGQEVYDLTQDDLDDLYDVLMAKDELTDGGIF